MLYDDGDYMSIQFVHKYTLTHTLLLFLHAHTHIHTLLTFDLFYPCWAFHSDFIQR